MRITEIDFGGARPIDGYGPGFFRVEGKRLDGPLLMLPDGPVSWAGLEDAAPIVAAAGRLDVVLVGTGAEIAAIPESFRRAVEDAGIGLEFMATGPACRSYNVLLNEGRRVAAALIPV